MRRGFITGSSPIPRTWRGRVPAALLVAALAVAGAGCGSSDDTSSGTTAKSATGTTTASADASLAPFQATVTKAMAGTPTAYSGPTEPAKAPSGIKIAMIVCDKTLPGCALDDAAAAAKKLGWSVTSYNGQSNPDVQNRAIASALASGVKAILLGGIDPRLVQRGLKAAKAAGVVVGSTVQGGFSPTPKLPLAAGQANVDFDVSADWVAMGAATAAAVVKDSGGKAHVLVISDPEFFSVDLEIQGAMAQFAKCPGCKTDTMKISAAQLTTRVPQDIVGYLNAHPDVKYVYAPYDGIPLTSAPAIRQAGLDVKMTGLQGNAPSLDLIRSGNVQFADVAFAVGYTGWAAIDQTIRLLNKQPLSEPVGENVPWQLLTKENVGSAKGTFTAPFDYQSKYMALWK